MTSTHGIIAGSSKRRRKCGAPGDYPDFGYYFLRLASDRLLQNTARLEGIVEQHKVKLEAATAKAR